MTVELSKPELILLIKALTTAHVDVTDEKFAYALATKLKALASLLAK